MEKRERLVLSAEERETIILFDDSSQECRIYTCSRPMMTKLDKLCATNPKGYRLLEKDLESKTYITKKNLISFRSEKQKRELTEAERAELSERARKNLQRKTVEKNGF